MTIGYSSSACMSPRQTGSVVQCGRFPGSAGRMMIEVHHACRPPLGTALDTAVHRTARMPVAGTDHAEQAALPADTCDRLSVGLPFASARNSLTRIFRVLRGSVTARFLNVSRTSTWKTATRGCLTGAIRTRPEEKRRERRARSCRCPSLPDATQPFRAGQPCTGP